MSSNPNIKKSHKEWRKEAKKFRRKRIRQKLARKRDEKEKIENENKQNDPTYQLWIQEQKALELFQEKMEKSQHDQEEQEWKKRELFAQKKFAEEKRKQEQIEKIKEKERLTIQKEFEKQQELIKQRIEEKKRLAEEALKKHQIFLEKILEYVECGGDMPVELLEKAETNPGKDICLFFQKTGSCRYGDKCSRNHTRPGISRILLIPHFFNHIRLEQNKVTEYGNDLILEFSDEELYKDYETFFEDVVPELEKFGRIEIFRTSQNYEPHLRGNVYVEYREERDALRAFMKLQGRYYASKRINIEFCALTSWKSALCGLSLTKRCPKGRNCNFVHVFKNPKNKYSISTKIDCNSELIETRKADSTPCWNECGTSSKDRNWRWSESPEHEESKMVRNRSRDINELKSNKRRHCSRSRSKSKSSSSSCNHKDQNSKILKEDKQRKRKKEHKRKSKKKSKSKHKSSRSNRRKESKSKN